MMKMAFKESLKVVAESISQKTKAKANASATLISSNIASKKSEQVKENIKVDKIHPAKKRRDKKLEEVKNSKNKSNTYTERDIMDLVRKIRSKTK